MFANLLWLIVLATFQTSGSALSERSASEIEKIKPVNLNLRCVRYVQTAEDLSPILLLHGLAGSMVNWESMYELLGYATRRMICAVDLRNHGESGRSNETDIAAMTADVHHLLKIHNVPKISIIGHSLGGKVGVHYAVNFPQMVDKLVVEDMGPNDMTLEARQYIQFYVKLEIDAIDAVPKGSTVEEAQAVVADFFNKRFQEMNLTRRVDENTRKSFHITCSSEICEWKTYRGLLDRIIKEPEGLMTLSNGTFNGPTLFIYGEASPFKVYDDRDQILELFPQAKFYGIRGAGHALHGLYREFDLQVIKFFNK